MSAHVDTSPVEAPQPKLHRSFEWVREALVIGAIYVVYGLVRNQFGSAKVGVGDAPLHAFNNAMRIIDFEKAVGLFHEKAIQDLFLGTGWVTFFNVFYGTAHFIVTLGVLIWLFVRHRPKFGRWRTTLMAATILALVGFALFPLMPPRLLDAGEPYGGRALAEQLGKPAYGFVDTLRDGSGLWSFDSSKMDQVSNQYAAMPSLHIAWSLWCALVLWQFARRRWVRYLALLYPFVTLVAIVATANHYIIDAAGGIAIIVAGYLIAIGFEHLRRSRSHLEEDGVNGDVLLPG